MAPRSVDRYAMNDPNLPLALLGAAKNRILGEQWRDEIIKYMAECATIGVVLGKGASIDWEVKEIFLRGHTNKTVFILPPLFMADQTAHHLRLHVSDGDIALTLLNDKEAVIFSAFKRDGRAYAEAADLGLAFSL